MQISSPIPPGSRQKTLICRKSIALRCIRVNCKYTDLKKTVLNFFYLFLMVSSISCSCSKTSGLQCVYLLWTHFVAAAVKHSLINSLSLKNLLCLANKWATWKVTLVAPSFSFFVCLNKFYCDKIFCFKVLIVLTVAFLWVGNIVMSAWSDNVKINCILLTQLKCHCLINMVLCYYNFITK